MNLNQHTSLWIGHGRPLKPQIVCCCQESEKGGGLVESTTLRRSPSRRSWRTLHRGVASLPFENVRWRDIGAQHSQPAHISLTPITRTCASQLAAGLHFPTTHSTCSECDSFFAISALPHALKGTAIDCPAVNWPSVNQHFAEFYSAATYTYNLLRYPY